MQKKFQQVGIGLASPKQIRDWAVRRLPTGELVGEVTSWETVNYKTLKPEPNGLFCQRIFGPVVDYSCACGKKPTKVSGGFCLKCGVERTTSRVRRYRLGYIKLKQPIVHTLYASHRPSPLSICLNWSNKRIQAIMYATEFCKLPPRFITFLSRRLIHRAFFNHFEKKRAITKKSVYNSKNTSFFYTKKITCGTNQYCIRQKISYFEYTQRRSNYKKPRLFTLEKRDGSEIQTRQIYRLRKKLKTDFFLYALTYDATWRQVENLQDFLFYISEQRKEYDLPIPYYYLARGVKNTSRGEIPRHEQFYPIQTGGFVFQKIFSYVDLLALYQQLRLHYYHLKNSILYLQEKLKWYTQGDEESIKNRNRILKKLTRLKEYEKKFVKRLHYFRDFYTKEMNPAWMILSYLPVLPPGLRPIMSIQGELIVSDINSLYRKVLTRNKRVTSVTKFKIFDTALSGSWASWCYNLRQVQEAVDSLLKKGSNESGKTTKSLLDCLKGKKGRFRQHLLGKRVDYSGRSVIVVGPNLKLYECGLPKQMALELFQPFLIQKLRNKRIALTTTAAKTIITQKKPIIWSLLAEIVKNHPVLLNRAPTLHRLGIQAFLPRLVEGKAILLHPLVCPAFNADFDGDQMAVHIPLGAASRSEAFQLMWSRNHILAPASGQPLLLPSQDMVLGCYYLTIFKISKLKEYKTNVVKRLSFWNRNQSFGEKKVSSKFLESKNKLSGYYFSTLYEVQQNFDQGKIEIHTPIWLRWFGKTQNFLTEQESKFLEQPIEFRLTLSGKSEYIFHDRRIEKSPYCSDSFSTLTSCEISLFIRTTPGRVLFHNQFPD